MDGTNLIGANLKDAIFRGVKSTKNINIICYR
ncbi:MAG: hypothetical protein KME64_20350 [Scytonematopsis contorta HA4267-MV1]|nr:hypothetical protein [Scytonematopsis contorta HA4267-MV1]